MPRLFADHAFRPAYNSARNSYEAYEKLRRDTAGSNKYTYNMAAVTAVSRITYNCITPCIDHMGDKQTENLFAVGKSLFCLDFLNLDHIFATET